MWHGVLGAYMERTAVDRKYTLFQSTFRIFSPPLFVGNGFGSRDRTVRTFLFFFFSHIFWFSRCQVSSSFNVTRPGISGVGRRASGVGRRGSVCDLRARGHRFAPRLRRMCSDVVLLGKTRCSHVHSLDPGVSWYLVGQWRLVCLNSSVRRKRQPGCVLPGQLRWLMNEQVLWPWGNSVKSGE